MAGKSSKHQDIKFWHLSCLTKYGLSWFKSNTIKKLPFVFIRACIEQGLSGMLLAVTWIARTTIL
jgi:hypothetical protein